MKDLFLLSFVFIASFDKYFLFFKLNTASAVLTIVGEMVATVVGDVDDEPESSSGSLPPETIKPFQVKPFAGKPVAVVVMFAVAPVAT